MNQKIAIIGGGLSGIALANQLHKSSVVTVFEKSSGVSGRMATRSAAPFEFDHGAQFFTSRSDTFKDFLLPYLASETVTEWRPKILTLEKGKRPFKRLWYETHYVAQPKMTSLVKAMAASIDIELKTKIERIEHQNDRWSLVSDDEVVGECFDWVISAVPALQAQEIFNASGVNLSGLSLVEYSPCFALMVGLSPEVQLSFDAALVKNSSIKWIAVNSTKTGRSMHKALVVHSCNSWARDNLEGELSHIQDQLVGELAAVTGLSAGDFSHIDIARWRYAKVSEAAPQELYLNASLRIAACGDWCLGNRVEDAFLSAIGLSKKLVQEFSGSSLT